MTLIRRKKCDCSSYAEISLESRMLQRLDCEIDDLTFRSFKAAYEEELHRYNGLAGSSATFNYASALILQPKKKPELIKRGNELIRSLYNESHDDSLTGKYLLYMAIAEAKLGFPEKAIRLVDSILEINPQNKDAIELKNEIEEMKFRELSTTALTFGAAGLLGAAIVGLFTFGKQRSKKKG
ncbi:hypothetical protein ACOME3_003699 [Neoechinorhynchus agilis]